MNQKTIDRLVERLGMTSELAPLLDSGNGYERFENALSELFGRYKTRGYALKIGSKNVGIEDAHQAISYFKRYWGIGCDEQSIPQIAFSDFGLQRHVNWYVIKRMPLTELKKIIEAEGREREHIIERVALSTEKRKEFLNEVKTKDGARILMRNGIHPAKLGRVQKYLNWMEYSLKRNRKEIWYGTI